MGIFFSDEKYVWVRLNSYALLLVGLAASSSLDFFSPYNSEIASRTGEIPTLFPAWTIAYLASALFILLGLLRVNRILEVIGLVLICVGIFLSTVSAFYYLGFNSYLGIQRTFILLLVLWTSGMRISTLLSPKGITVTIPPRGMSVEDSERAHEMRSGDGEAV